MERGRTTDPSMQARRARLEAALRKKLAQWERPEPSPGQEWLVFLDKLQPSVALYNIPVALRLQGRLDLQALEGALTDIIGRHEALRMLFHLEGDGTLQTTIAPPEKVLLPVTDLRTLPEEEREQLALQMARRESEHRIDLSKGSPFRLNLIRLADELHMLVFVVHHAVFDMGSLGVFLRELSELYTGRVTGRPPSVPELTYTFSEFARQQRQMLQGGAEDQLRYWQSVLAGPLPVLQLPTDRAYPVNRSYRGALCSRPIPPELITALSALSRREGATLFMALLAAYTVLLHRYTHQDEILVGIPVANRNRVELEPLIGMFISTVAIRADLGGSPTFRQLLGRVREGVLGAFAHQDVPFVKVVEALRDERKHGQNSVFQTMFTVEGEPEPLHMPDLVARTVEGLESTTKFDLSLVASRTDQGWSAGFMYDTELYTEATVARMADHFIQLLRSMVAEPERPVPVLPMLTKAERHRLVTEWNDTRRAYPTDRLIHQVVAERAQQDPQGLAIVQGDERITYAELDQHANAVAAELHRQGVRPGSLVGVCLERSIGLIVGLLGVWKAGAAYIAMDPTHPSERLLHMLTDADAAALVTSRALADRFGNGSVPVICLDSDLVRARAGEPEGPGSDALGATAYVIYTSGSTGAPKGIRITHRSLLNVVHWFLAYYELTATDRTSQSVGPGFDATVFEIWTTLAAGATLFIVDEGTRLDRVKFRDWLVANRITVSVLTAPLVEGLISLPWPAQTSLRVMLSGGDRLTRFPPPSLPFTLVNNYGPTEATVISTAGVVPKPEQPQGMPAIGRPIFNAKIYLLDSHLQPVPVGVPGEIYIAGDGLAEGYVGRPDLTAERFIENPLEPGTRIYRTGDLARYLPDGSLDYIGRNDEQVKIRGLRIELGEIEAVLGKHPAVAQCVVLVREDEPGDRRLVAYLVLRTESETTMQAIREHLRQFLPSYMVPSAFVTLPDLPVTANGKIDRQALPRPEGVRRAGAEEVLPPAGGTEHAVASIWRQVLGVDLVGSRDNFFDLGGHSLRLVQVQNLIAQELGVEIPLLDLFQFTTVSSLARRVDQLTGREPALPVADDAAADRRAGRPAASPQESAIAIVGMAGRFPGANSVAEFWANIRDGRDSVSRFTRAELEQESIDPADLDHPQYVAAKGVIDGFDRFDAGFFGFSPREAETLDPQQRLFLECAWEALEEAGYASDGRPEQTGVFAGCSLSTYLLNNLLTNQPFQRTVSPYQVFTANDTSFLATRTAYKLNLKGPAVTVQTACSTSLVAVHMACQSLLRGECDMALAGGSAVQSPMKEGYVYREGEVLSPDGTCRAFDAGAQGTINGAGVGVVVLKRLADALADRDTIHAVIRGSAINNDGSAKVGFTAPSIDGQAAVIQSALDAAGIGPETVTYVEAHGTGTVLGDPIEIAGLTKAYRNRGLTQTGTCAIGSVKTNVGHLDTAAGVAGLIKTAMALKAKQLPPSLNFETPNPRIDFAHSPFYVNTRLAPWPSEGGPRRAGVSSFGLGGTNAHAIVEEAPAVAASRDDGSWKLLPVSARSGGALHTAFERLAAHLKQEPSVNMADVAYTLHVGRGEFAHRGVLLCQGADDGLKSLESRDPGRLYLGEAGQGRDLVFMFPGQGSQHITMGRDLYRRFPVFQTQVDQMAQFLQGLLGYDLREVLIPAEEQAVEATDRLNETAVTQPALFVVEYALARLLMDFGLQPQAMIGHSIGEYVAACLAGVFTLEDALRLVAARGRLIQGVERGVMLAVSAAEEQVAPLLGPELSIAACNGPRATVISGREADVEGLRAELERRGILSRRLRTSHAFHSSLMDSILAAFEQEVRQVPLQPPTIPFVSNVTGRWITRAEATDPAYWAAHLRQTVRFADGLQVLMAEPGRLLLEVGPGRTLSTLARQSHPGRDVLSSMRHVQDQVDDDAQLLLTLGRLWLAGMPLNWRSLPGTGEARRIPLPTYPFERKRYWVEMGRKVGLTGNAAGEPEGAESGSAISLHERPELAHAFEAPAEGLQTAIASIWQEVLGIARIGVRDDFFELGGDSLMAARVVSRLAEGFPVDVPVSALFEGPTLGDLADRVEALLLEKLESLSDAEVENQTR